MIAPGKQRRYTLLRIGGHLVVFKPFCSMKLTKQR